MQKIIEILKLYNNRRNISKSNLFDFKFYLFEYPDVRHSDIDPIIHYLKHGWKEGRNPCRSFNTKFYIETYSDVKKKGINPLIHYIHHGQKEGRMMNKGEIIKKIKKRLEGNKLKPAFKNNNIAAVFSSNDKFANYLVVAIKSLIENISQKNNYDLIVLESDLKKKTIGKLLSLCDGIENVSLRFFNMKPYLSLIPKKIFFVEGYVPPETYNKFFLTDIFEDYEKCLYLDSDIVILEDVANLYNIDLGGKSIGASLNVANIYAANSNKKIKDVNFKAYLNNKLEMQDCNKYFQAGVLIIDLKKLYNSNLMKNCINKLNKIKRPIFFDQCIFNSLFYNDVKFFSTAWNHVWYLQKYSYLLKFLEEDLFYDFAHSRVAPKIIHYAGKNKPQNNSKWRLGEYFWKYAKMTPYFKEILSDCANNLSSSDYELLVSKINKKYHLKANILIHLHLYYYDQLEDMLLYLKNINGCYFDLYVTMPNDDQDIKNRILEVFDDAEIHHVENAGYDIYPFLYVLSVTSLDEYDYILKIHTKNRRNPGEDRVYSISVPGYEWRNELINALIGTKNTFKKNISLMQKYKYIGCIGAKRFIFSIKDNNEEKVYNLNYWKTRLNILKGSLYVGGSMFLARSYPFEKLKNLNFTADDFGNGAMETKDHGNLAHVFERLFGLIVCNEGFQIHGID